jgi:hypothetical protein
MDDNADKLTLPLFPPVMNHTFHVHFHLLGQDLLKIKKKKRINKEGN